LIHGERYDEHRGSSVARQSRHCYK